MGIVASNGTKDTRLKGKLPLPSTTMDRSIVAKCRRTASTWDPRGIWNTGTGDSLDRLVQVERVKGKHFCSNVSNVLCQCWNKSKKSRNKSQSSKVFCYRFPLIRQFSATGATVGDARFQGLRVTLTNNIAVTRAVPWIGHSGTRPTNDYDWWMTCQLTFQTPNSLGVSPWTLEGDCALI